MYWIVIEEQYLKYPREFEPRIPRTEYGEDLKIIDKYRSFKSEEENTKRKVLGES